MGQCDELVIDVSRSNGRTLVAVRGELDMATAPQLERSLLEIPCKQAVIVDCAGLDFVDCRGLSVLVRQVTSRRSAGGWLCISNVRPQLSTLLDLTGTDNLRE